MSIDTDKKILELIQAINNDDGKIRALTEDWINESSGDEKKKLEELARMYEDSLFRKMQLLKILKD